MCKLSLSILCVGAALVLSSGAYARGGTSHHAEFVPLKSSRNRGAGRMGGASIFAPTSSLPSDLSPLGLCDHHAAKRLVSKPPKRPYPCLTRLITKFIDRAVAQGAPGFLSE